MTNQVSHENLQNAMISWISALVHQGRHQRWKSFYNINGLSRKNGVENCSGGIV